MPTPAELEKILKQRQVRPATSLSVEPRKRGESIAGFQSGRLGYAWPVRSRELTDFTRQLATMVSARLPLVRSLEILAQQQKNKRLQEVIHTVRQSLVRGKSLRDSLAQHPQTFTPLFVNMVHVGEASGSLPEILQQFALYQEKISALKRKLATAMAYPGVIILVACGALSFLLFGVMPTFTDMFRDFGAPIPTPARILLAGSVFIKTNIVYLLLLLVVGLLLLKAWAQTPRGHWRFDRIKISIPLLGAVIRKILLARFARTLGTLIQAGVSLLEALDITAKSSGNLVFQAQILQMKEMAGRGEAMEKSLAGSKLFSPLVIQMIAVGEETAELGGMLLKTAEFYESEVDAAIEALTSIIEPVIIVVLGVILGGTIIAIYLQIFDLMNVIQ